MYLLIYVYLIGAVLSCIFSLIVLGYRSNVLRLKPTDRGLVPFINWIGAGIGIGIVWPVFFMFASLVVLCMTRDYCFREDVENV